MARAIEVHYKAWLDQLFDQTPTMEGIRAYTDGIPQDVALPALAFRLTEHTETEVLRGRTGLKKSRLETTIWSYQRGRSDEIMAAIKDGLHLRQGEPAPDFIKTHTRGGQSATVQYAKVENETNEREFVEEGSERLVYAAVFDAVIWFTGG